MTRRILSFIFITAAASAYLGCANDRSEAPMEYAAHKGDSRQEISGKNADAPAAGEMSPTPPPDEKNAPLLFNREKKSALTSYRVPEKLRERISEVQPTYHLPQSSKGFEVEDQTLTISAKHSTMTFSGVLKIPGRADEPIELQCHFDKAKLWSCGDMFPTDEKVAGERRMQATMNCLDSYRCERVGVELFVIINGKTESQLFQSEAFYVRQATSGDEDDDDTDADAAKGSERLPENSGKAYGRLPGRDEKPVEKMQGRLLPTPEPIQPVPPSPLKPVAPPAEQNPGPIPLPPGVESHEGLVGKPAESAAEKGSFFGPPPSDTLTDDQLNTLLDDPNAAIEILAPIPQPPPVVNKLSIPGIEKLRPQIDANVRNQAVGSHNRGHLQLAAKLPNSGPGFIARKPTDQAYGTDLMIGLLQGASAQVDGAYPQQPAIVVAAIANKNGGRLINRSGHAHASHETGLDADVGFPSVKPVSDLWPACQVVRGAKGTTCKSGSALDPQLDKARFWLFLKELTCAEKSPVSVMFLDIQIKKRMCEYVRSLPNENLNDPRSCASRTLKALKHWSGHYNHVHVRMHCPGNPDCRENTLDLGKGTGC
jgi:murein endopeptidase